MKKQLPKPEHWQDFEDLCKNLWGEIWGIPLKIKKNGRAGQSQNGVDIYGIPKGEKNYWGIQCKGKDEYTNAKLTKKEIDIELKTAKNFKPILKNFIIATTANKDARIEEYIRTLNINQIENDEFEIELFCWEDIVDEILKRKNILDLYLNLIKYKTEHDFELFVNDSLDGNVKINPLYYKGTIVDKVQAPLEIKVPWTQNKYGLNLLFDVGSSSSLKKLDLSCCPLIFRFINSGTKVIEDWKLIIDFGDNFTYLDTINSEEKKGISSYLKSDLEIEGGIVTFCDNKPFIQEDKREFKIWITPERIKYEKEIKWKLLARDFSLSGIINFIIEPIFEEKNLTNAVQHSYEIKSPREYTKPIIKYD